MVLGHENMTLSVLLLLITAYAFLMLEEMWVRAWFPKGEGFPEDNSGNHTSRGSHHSLLGVAGCMCEPQL